MIIKVDDFDVVQKGVLVVNSKNTITFSLDNIEFAFSFVKDDNGNKRIDQEQQGVHKLLTKLVNFDNSLGTGVSEPIEVATLSTGEKLYVLFAVYGIAEDLRVFHYTWLKKRVQEEGGANE